MKKLYIILVFLVAFSPATIYGQKTKFGIRAGVSIPELKSVDNNIYSKDYSSVTGFDGSLFGDFGITENFSIKTELGFIRKGGERNGMQPIPSGLLGDLSSLLPPGQAIWADFNNEAVFSYIEIPVLAKYEWHLDDTWGIYVNGGPYLDFMINPKQKTSGVSSFYYDETGTMPVQIPVNPQDPPQNWVFIDLPPQDLTAETDISKDLATVDFGAMLGVGVSAAIGERSDLFLDIRGSYGFIPLQKDKDTYGTVHMGNVSFAIGYAYTIGDKAKKEPKE